MKVFEHTKNIAWTILAIAATIFVIKQMSSGDEIILDTKTLSANSLSAITNGEMTNEEMISNINKYRTNIPWIAASNNRIWAGLFNRDWSIDYSISSESFDNEIGFMLGTGFGLYYHRTIFECWTIGIDVIFDKEKDFNAFGKVGYKW